MTARILAGVAAAAVVIAGLLGANLIQQRSVNADLTELLTTATRRVSLAPQGGFQGHGVLHIASGRAALVLDELPKAGKHRIYELWALSRTNPQAMAVVGGRATSCTSSTGTDRPTVSRSRSSPTEGHPSPPATPCCSAHDGQELPIRNRRDPRRAGDANTGHDRSQVR